ncbi:hypothetical protein CF65_01174 [Aggregatibacter actinomycetemcomitans HK1651]|nr:hypothetical protein CF65_01174 [Aggregatibacter actinomycetemcomitans HK1651]
MQLVAPILNILVQQVAPYITTRQKCGRFFNCFLIHLIHTAASLPTCAL